MYSVRVKRSACGVNQILLTYNTDFHYKYIQQKENIGEQWVNYPIRDVTITGLTINHDKIPHG